MTIEEKVSNLEKVIENTSMIKSVKRGRFSGSASTYTITINAVNPSKCSVSLYNSIISASTSSISGATVTSLTSTVLTITANYYNSYYTVGWEIVEYN